MDTPENKNFFKLAFILLEITTERLRNIFKQEWDTQHPNNPWRDDNNSLQYFIHILKNGGTWKNNKSKVPKSGDRNDWDPTALFFMLLYSGALNLHAMLKQHVNKLREIRNEYFGHPSSASLSDTKFQVVYKDIEVCMCALNCSATVKKQMDDIRIGVMKVPEDYMKVVDEKLCKIERLEADNQDHLLDLQNAVRKMQNAVRKNYELLTQLQVAVRKKYKLILLTAFILVLVILISVIYMYLQYLQLNPHHTDLRHGRTCQNSKTYFPESNKPNYYVGHNWEIDTATNLLTNGTYQMITITGPPAIGKTATAVAIGQVLKKRHNFQVAFVDFKQLKYLNSTQIREDMFREIAFSLGGVPETDVDSLQKFKTYMRKITSFPTLLILDNTENILDFESKTEFFKVIKLCLATNNIQILATSRTDFDITGVSMYPIKLEPLSEEQSVEVLLKLSPSLQESSVLEISKKIGGVPLLLELTGSLLQRGVYEEDELIAKLEELPILTIVNDTIDLTESSNYFKFLKTLFDGLDADLQNTFIALGTIPMSFDQITANLVAKPNLTGRVNLYLLVNYNLLKKYQSATGEIRYEMHSVISEFSRLVAKEKPQWSQIQCNSSFIFFDHVRQELQDSRELQNALDAEGLVSIQLLLAAQDQIHKSCQNEDKWTNHMLPLVSSALQEHGDLYLQLFQLCHITVTPQHLIDITFETQRNELQIYAKLVLRAAQDYIDYNLTQSINYYHLFLMITDKFVETDDELQMRADVYAQIGHVSFKLQKYADAAFAWDKALTIRLQSDHPQETKNEYDKETATIAANLGVAYQSLQQYNESIKPLRIASQINEKLPKHDFDHKLHVYTSGDLARAYNWTENYEACYQTIQMCLKIPNISQIHHCPHFYVELMVLGMKASYKTSDYSTLFWYLKEFNMEYGLQYSFNYISAICVHALDYLNFSSLSLLFGIVFGIPALATQLSSLSRHMHRHSGEKREEKSGEEKKEKRKGEKKRKGRKREDKNYKIATN
ncbi:uncharacterized protein [Amphiura filiformis]|uniref:uncharacterized protein n=1 Tax=Amphiura filiformis TaxID=82378 RepID=UPI003B217779